MALWLIFKWWVFPSAVIFISVFALVLNKGVRFLLKVHFLYVSCYTPNEVISLLIEKTAWSLWDHHSVCVCIPLSTFECLNQSSWNLVLYHGTWPHLNGVLHKFLPLVCVSNMCIPLIVSSNGSVNTFPRQRIRAAIEELLDTSFSLRSVSYQRRVYRFVCVSCYRC
jgi:hypothetical protein